MTAENTDKIRVSGRFRKRSRPPEKRKRNVRGKRQDPSLRGQRSKAILGNDADPGKAKRKAKPFSAVAPSEGSGNHAPAGVGEPGQEVSPDKPVVATPSAGSAAEPERQANRPSQAGAASGN
jgi:hypothetical protein